MSVCLVKDELSAILNTNGLNTATGVVWWVDWVYAGNSERFWKGGQLTSWAFYRDDAGSNVDLDILGDLELFLRVDVQHLEKPPGGREMAGSGGS